MNRLRSALQVTRFVLVWFALSIGAAVASPWVHPKAMDWVCSGSGAMKWVVVDDAADSDAAATVVQHTLDCPMCASFTAPLPLTRVPSWTASPLAQALQPLTAAHIAAATAPPLPSRGPPVLSL